MNTQTVPSRQPSTYFTVEEIAAQLRVSPAYIYREVRRHHLGATRLGRVYRISEAALAAYLQRAEQVRE